MFNNLIPRNFDLRIDFMQELLKYFSIDTGKRKNKSCKFIDPIISNHVREQVTSKIE
ncbi:MAG: hypothetical protein ACOCRO_04515 [Halanaerobiales bacterium]